MAGRSLQEWDEAGKVIMRVYLEELGRPCDFGGAINWLAHWRDDEGFGGASFEEWLRARFRESEEWQITHGGGRYSGGSPTPLPPPTPQPPAPQPTPQPPDSHPFVGRLLKVTDVQDGLIIPRTYSYWSNCWIGASAYYVFCGTSNGPSFFAVNRGTGRVTRLGNLVAPYGGETEGWFWDREGRVVVLAGRQLLRLNPLQPNAEVLIDLESLGPAYANQDLWQPHGSDDGSTFSATVRRVVDIGGYPKIGTLAVRRGVPFYTEAQGDLDESHVSGDGRYLIIEESNNDRVIHLDTKETRHLADEDGALSHIDCGPDFLVGEANMPDPQCCARMDLDRPLLLTARTELFRTSNMGHVSVKGGRCLLSDGEGLWWVDLQGGGRTFLRAHGMVEPPGIPDWQKYDFQVKANLDPTGQVACFLSNFGSSRQDVYLLEV